MAERSELARSNDCVGRGQSSPEDADVYLPLQVFLDSLTAAGSSAGSEPIRTACTTGALYASWPTAARIVQDACF